MLENLSEVCVCVFMCVVCYLRHQRWMEVMFSPLFVYEQDISESYADSNETWWTGWMCDNDVGHGFFTHPNLLNKFCPNQSRTFWDIVLHIAFGQISQWWRMTLKILVTGSISGSSPKCNRFVLEHTPNLSTFLSFFFRICPQLFEILCFLSFLDPISH